MEINVYQGIKVFWNEFYADHVKKNTHTHKNLLNVNKN